MEAFATVTELGVMLGQVFTDGSTEAAQAEQLLQDASDHLREIIGQDVTAGTTTYTDKVPAGAHRLTLPQQPVRSIDEVLVNGLAWTSYELDNGELVFARYGDLSWSNHFPLVGSSLSGLVPVTVTYSHGTTVIPADLNKWARVLAAQALAQLEAFGSIGSAGLTSQRIDDFAENFGTDASSEAFSISPAVAKRLRRRYGRAAYVSRGASELGR